MEVKDPFKESENTFFLIFLKLIFQTEPANQASDTNHPLAHYSKCIKVPTVMAKVRREINIIISFMCLLIKDQKLNHYKNINL